MKAGLESVPQREYRPLIALYVDALRALLGKNLVAVALYGSVARGEARPGSSDIDLYIVAEGLPKHFDERLRLLDEANRAVAGSQAYKEAAARGLYAQFAEHPLTPSEASRHGPLDLEVYADGIILHDPDGFLGRKFADLASKLESLGARLERTATGERFWVLKAHVRRGEIIEI